MRVDIDEPGRHHAPPRIDRFARRRARQLPDRRNRISPHRDIAIKPGIAGTVDNAAIHDEQVVLSEHQSGEKDKKEETHLRSLANI